MHAFQKPLVICCLVSACAAWSGGVLSQQTIANPLIRPAMLQGAPVANGPDSSGATQRPAEQAATGDAADLRRQAERRITQEDLNIRQQALNSPVLPVPLINLFSNMQVKAP